MQYALGGWVDKKPRNASIVYGDGFGIKALKEAMDTFGNVLARWQRASGDFHSTVELLGQDEDAATNARIVDEQIAALVDQLKMMQSMMQGLGEQKEGLEQMLEGLRGMIPGPMDNPGPGDEEGDEFPDGPEPGQEEAASRDGREMPLSPEDARRLLDAFQLDRNRNLPMGFDREAKPEETNKGKNW